MSPLPHFRAPEKTDITSRKTGILPWLKCGRHPQIPRTELGSEYIGHRWKEMAL